MLMFWYSSGDTGFAGLGSREGHADSTGLSALILGGLLNQWPGVRSSTRCHAFDSVKRVR